MTASPSTQAATDTAFQTENKVRIVTAAALFDGHDASINIMRRVLQSEGAEVIHLGHNRSVEQIVEAAIQEGAQGIAVSSYQGGHMEYFTYMVELLRKHGAGHIKVFGGGGGVIVPDEIEALHAAGVTRIFSVEDGRSLGLIGMIRHILTECDYASADIATTLPEGFAAGSPLPVAQVLTCLEQVTGTDALPPLRDAIRGVLPKTPAPILGITGTGGAGKSSLTDELLRRLLDHYPDRRFAVLSVDPTRRRTGGALLGDRIRMNSAHGPRVFMRSMATRRAHLATSESVRDALLALRAAAYDLVILETAGIGQSDSEVVDLSDLSLYVMTPDFGAPTQLEKIDMLDFADLVAINKADKRGADDALRDVRKQVRRNHTEFHGDDAALPVHLTCASRYGDAGVDALFVDLMKRVSALDEKDWDPGEPPSRVPELPVVLPPQRVRYLAEICESIRAYRAQAESQADLASRADGIARALRELGDTTPATAEPYDQQLLLDELLDPAVRTLRQRYNSLICELTDASRLAIASFEKLKADYAAPAHSYSVRGRRIEVENSTKSLAGSTIPKVALPRTADWGDILRWRLLENVPGEFPYSAGVFPYKRTEEDPTRMFAGEGPPERTNRRFHYVSQGQPAVRLSTAFDSVTLYGEDPAAPPDIYGKIGNAGVSICTVDDAKRLYSGFDLASPKCSVSMTINGPAPMMLAFFLNTAIDQQVEKRLKETGRWEAAQEKIRELCGGSQPSYRRDLPAGHDGAGLGLLGVSGEQFLPADEYAEIKASTLSTVRGTVQADILKEDQAQNTCIFSTEFALKMMGDVQSYFVDHEVRNFYSVSVSGYHIAEAGANPITQLALTLANGFTYVEAYLARGLSIDAFAPNLSFFFSNGLDPEYAVIGRVARRIWATAMRDRYGADERSQKLKYHIQTSGRSLHAQEVSFNDIRTTLQALYAIYDNCNSLHTNAYDEAITTPTEESVRRALAIQLIINREFGLTKNENPLQGSFVIDELTDLVEEAVLAEFDRISERGGVLGAMELMYQRSKIQEESLHYEERKMSGELPIVGVNTFLSPNPDEMQQVSELIRSSDDEKKSQIDGLRQFHDLHRSDAEAALARLRQVALEGSNLFAELMETVKVCSLGQITRTLYEVGGQYRRSM